MEVHCHPVSSTSNYLRMTPAPSSILPAVARIQAVWRKELREGRRMPQGPVKAQCGARLKVRSKGKK